MPGFKFSEPSDCGIILVPAIQLAGTGYPNYFGNCDISIAPWIIGYESTYGNCTVTIPKLQVSFGALNINEGEIQIPSVSIFGHSEGLHFEFFDVNFSPLLVSVSGSVNLNGVGNGLIPVPDVVISSATGVICEIFTPPVQVSGFAKRVGSVGNLVVSKIVNVELNGSGFLSCIVGSDSFLALPKISVLGTGVKQPALSCLGEIEVGVSALGDGFLVGICTCDVAIPAFTLSAFGKLDSIPSLQTLGDVSIPLVSITGSAFVQEDFEFSETDAVLRYSFDRRLL